MRGLRSPDAWPRKGALDLIAAVRDRVEVVSTEEAATEYASGGAVILDVREPEEWSAGHIPGAIHVPRGRLELWADPTVPGEGVPILPDQRILVISGTGLRSILAAATLRDMGYDRVASVEGGIEAWVVGGRVLEGGPDRPSNLDPEERRT